MFAARSLWLMFSEARCLLLVSIRLMQLLGTTSHCPFEVVSFTIPTTTYFNLYSVYAPALLFSAVYRHLF